jgi:hypothetical protein
MTTNGTEIVLMNAAGSTRLVTISGTTRQLDASGTLRFKTDNVASFCFSTADLFATR